jgi:hypothetical protein
LVAILPIILRDRVVLAPLFIFPFGLNISKRNALRRKAIAFLVRAFKHRLIMVQKKHIKNLNSKNRGVYFVQRGVCFVQKGLKWLFFRNYWLQKRQTRNVFAFFVIFLPAPFLRKQKNTVVCCLKSNV